MNPWLGHIVLAAEISPLLVLGWAIFRKLSRFLDVMKDFPPHRHVNGKISYPKGFSPGVIEKAETESASN